MTFSTRRNCSGHRPEGRSSSAVLAPPSDTSFSGKALACCRPRLSYTPPSLNTTLVVYGGRYRGGGVGSSANGLTTPGASFRRSGERNGGKAEDAATATAS